MWRITIWVSNVSRTRKVLCYGFPCSRDIKCASEGGKRTWKDQGLWSSPSRMLLLCHSTNVTVQRPLKLTQFISLPDHWVKDWFEPHKFTTLPVLGLLTRETAHSVAGKANGGRIHSYRGPDLSTTGSVSSWKKIALVPSFWPTIRKHLIIVSTLLWSIKSLQWTMCVLWGSTAYRVSLMHSHSVR